MLRQFISILIILCQTQKILTLISSVVNYSDLNIGLNYPECGLNLVPTVKTLIFEKKCFIKEYPSKIYIDFERPKEETVNTPKGRVLKGHDAEPYEVPWVVYLEPIKWHRFMGYTFKTPGICTGVLITFQWVLTAAHCYEDWKKAVSSGISVFAGSNAHPIYGKSTQKIHAIIKHWFSHPLYTTKTKQKDKSVYDIALIKLDHSFKREVIFQKYKVNTICLPENKDVYLDQYSSERATFYGYGAISDEYGARNLQKGEIQQLLPSISCPNSFCCDFSGDKPRICEGDSGGPLLQYSADKVPRAILIGITREIKHRKGESGCGSGINLETSLFSSVPFHMNWIIETIKNN